MPPPLRPARTFFRKAGTAAAWNTKASGITRGIPPQAADYMARQTQDQMRPLVNNPMFLGWMEPLGETSPGPWLDEHRDLGPNAQKDWQAELRDRQRLTLAEVSRMRMTAPEAPFTSWDQVMPPTFDLFEGWPEPDG